MRARADLHIASRPTYRLLGDERDKPAAGSILDQDMLKRARPTRRSAYTSIAVCSAAPARRPVLRASKTAAVRSSAGKTEQCSARSVSTAGLVALRKTWPIPGAFDIYGAGAHHSPAVANGEVLCNNLPSGCASRPAQTAAAAAASAHDVAVGRAARNRYWRRRSTPPPPAYSIAWASRWCWRAVVAAP